MFVIRRTADEARSFDTKRRDVSSTECLDLTRYLDRALRVAGRGANTFELTLAQSVSSAASKTTEIWVQVAITMPMMSRQAG